MITSASPPCPECGKPVMVMFEPYGLGGHVEIQSCVCGYGVRILPPQSEIADFTAPDAPGRNETSFATPNGTEVRPTPGSVDDRMDEELFILGLL